MKINEVDKVTTLAGGECITAIAADKSLIQIPVAELAKVMAQVMPVATSENDGLMSVSVLKSIYSFNSTIHPRGTFDTGIMRGGLILFQNTGLVHDIAVAIMHADGRGTVICTAPHVSFFSGSGRIDVRKESSTKSIQIVNNTEEAQHFSFRVVCSII